MEGELTELQQALQVIPHNGDLGNRSTKTPSRAANALQLVELLPSMHEALFSVPALV